MEFGQFFKFAIVLVFVLGLIGLLAIGAKRIGFTPRATRPTSGAKKRLAIVEVLAVDAKRRLILIRRDDKEHLVMLGMDRDLLIESDVNAPPEAQAEGGDVRSFLDIANRGANRGAPQDRGDAE